MLVEILHFVPLSWAFYQWGKDILGPFQLEPDQLKFLIVRVNYFPKWIYAYIAFVASISSGSNASVAC